MAIASSSRRLLALALALAACGLVLLATGLSGPARRAALVSDPDTALEMPAAGVHTIAKTQRRQYKLAAAAPAAHMHPSQLTLPARASKLGLADRIRQAVRDAAAKAKAAVEAAAEDARNKAAAARAKAHAAAAAYKAEFEKAAEAARDKAEKVKAAAAASAAAEFARNVKAAWDARNAADEGDVPSGPDEGGGDDESVADFTSGPDADEPSSSDKEFISDSGSSKVEDFLAAGHRYPDEDNNIWDNAHSMFDNAEITQKRWKHANVDRGVSSGEYSSWFVGHTKEAH